MRDLLLAARAVDDPSDELALVAALRSPLFGCGDDDLLTWKRGRRLVQPARRPPRTALPPTTRSAGAIAYLRRPARRAPLADARASCSTASSRDRRMLELGLAGPRARDVWRRLRFVVDQARAWTEAEHGGLRAYLALGRTARRDEGPGSPRPCCPRPTTTPCAS